IQATERAGVCHMRQDRSTPITETAEEPTGCGPDGYGGFAHHHRSVLDHRRSRLTSSEQAWVRRQVGTEQLVIGMRLEKFFDPFAVFGKLILQSKSILTKLNASMLLALAVGS